MECFKLEDISREIQLFKDREENSLTKLEKRRWKVLQELVWCKPIVDFLNVDCDKVCKDISLEAQGIDCIIEQTNGAKIYLQLVNANDYDMKPTPGMKEINLSGIPIVGAASKKCLHYCKRGIDMKNIVLLINGNNIGTKIDELVKEASFLREFERLPCFKEIYYITDKGVYCLKSGI